MLICSRREVNKLDKMEINWAEFLRKEMMKKVELEHSGWGKC